MRKFFFIATIIALGIVATILSARAMFPAKGPMEEIEIELDVPTQDNHIVVVNVAVTYYVSDPKVLIDQDEADSRVYSNLLVAFRLATAGAMLEDIQGVLDKDKLQGKIEEGVAYFNSAPYEVVKVTSIKFLSMRFDPPAEDFEEEPLEESCSQPALNINPKGATVL